MIRTQLFTVPAGAGAYAPEELYFNVDNDKRSMPDAFDRLSLDIAQLPATAAVEVDLLKPGAEPGAGNTSYRLIAKTYNTLGIQALLELARQIGGRVRVKSGGTAGTAEVDAAWSMIGR